MNYWTPGNLNYVSSFMANVLPLKKVAIAAITTSTKTTTTASTTTGAPPKFGSAFTQILLDDSAFNGVVTPTIPSVLGLDNLTTTAELNNSRSYALDLHNYYRSLHVNTTNLTLDKTVNAVAQSYSQYLAQQADYNLVPSKNAKFGENLFLYCQYGVIPNQTSELK
jgi:uncharacterized protein YkwD